MRRTDPEMLAKIQQVFTTGGDRRPPLYRWMASHYEELVEMFDGARLNWSHLTASFQEGGFVNGCGGDLNPETVRQAWYRVRKREEALRSRRVSCKAAVVEVLNSPAPVPRPPPTASSSPPTPMPVNDALASVIAEMNRRSGRM